MPSALPSGKYEAGTDPESIRALQELVRLCRENRIRLVVFSSPILQTTYEEALQNGYADFLKDVGEIVPYYCFSGLNSYTTHAEYYFDNSHYKPYVGLQMEKVMFGDERAEENFGERKGRGNGSQRK